MTEQASTARGACHCGSVRYAIDAKPSFAFLCHCDNCKKLNGGSRLAGISFPRDALSVTGESKSYRYRGGKDDIELHFCPTCGTPLYAFPAAHQDIVVIRANSLEKEDDFKPVKSLFSDQACAWDPTL